MHAIIFMPDSHSPFMVLCSNTDQHGNNFFGHCPLLGQKKRI